MSESGCLKNIACQNLDVTGSINVSGLFQPKGGDMTTVTNINEETYLTSAQCGTIILGAAVGVIQAVDAGFNVNLPAPQKGLNYHFILRPPSIANNANAAITVTSTSNGTAAANISVGSVTVNEVPTNVVQAKEVLTFVHNAATCGDYAKCVCDGTNWFFTAVGDAAGSITLA